MGRSEEIPVPEIRKTPTLLLINSKVIVYFRIIGFCNFVRRLNLVVYLRIFDQRRENERRSEEREKADQRREKERRSGERESHFLVYFFFSFVQYVGEGERSLKKAREMVKVSSVL